MALDHVDQFISDMRIDPIFAPLADDMAFGLAELDEPNFIRRCRGY
jgi:hypothetical protein